MEHDIKIDAGLTRITINGGPAFIEFNPNDLRFAERYYTLYQTFNEKQKEYQKRLQELAADKRRDENGQPANLSKGLDTLLEICNFMREQIDVLFGEGTSQTVFGNTYVLEAFLQFFDGVTPYITEARSEKVQQYAIPANGKKREKRSRRRRVMK